MRICSASGSSACKQHLPSLEVEGDMEDIPHSYLIDIIHYVFIVKQATLQPEMIRKVLQQHYGVCIWKTMKLWRCGWKSTYPFGRFLFRFPKGNNHTIIGDLSL